MALALLFGVHGHQPVGNFPAVLHETHERCYRPFLETVHRYPEFRFSAHFSGWLLEYLIGRFPGDIGLLQEMVVRGQVELFGGGDCEPVLMAIPQRDRVGQLAAMAARLRRHFGAAPQGAWLTERVWEASVVPALAECGIRYVIVDDYHFLCTGKTAAELDGYYTTEEDGRTLDVFPISEQLRYRLPFSPAHEAVGYLERLADEGGAAAIYFDDIEKFGIWPETWDWVYGERWLERFIEGVLASPKIRPATYREFHDRHATRGIVYLPATSYIEMNEWTLPPAAAEAYAELARREKEAGHYERDKGFVRGGIWRSFLTRYPEANWTHKRMLALSQRLAALAPEHRAPELTQALYRAQGNDAYWHGLFGGIYLPHLRREVFRNLLEVEAGLDAVAPRPPAARLDLDHDGVEELFLLRPRLQAVLRLDGEAFALEFDSYLLKHNFGDVLRRTPEHYYRKLRDQERADEPASGIASAHNRVSFKHEVAGEDLVPDAHPRGLFHDHWTASDGRTSRVAGYRLEGLDAGRRAATFSAPIGRGTLVKRFALEENRLVVTYCCEGVGNGTMATELNLALPSCDGFGGRYILADGSIPCGLGQALDIAALTTILLDDRELRGGLALTLSRAAAFRARPHHTVSQSEAGFERIMQGATVTLAWAVGEGRSEIRVALEVRSD